MTEAADDFPGTQARRRVASRVRPVLTMKMSVHDLSDVPEIRQLAQHTDDVIGRAVDSLRRTRPVSARLVLKRANQLSEADGGPTFGDPESDPQKKKRKMRKDSRYGVMKNRSGGGGQSTASTAKSTRHVRVRGGDFRNR